MTCINSTAIHNMSAGSTCLFHYTQTTNRTFSVTHWVSLSAENPVSEITKYFVFHLLGWLLNKQFASILYHQLLYATSLHNKQCPSLQLRPSALLLMKSIYLRMLTYKPFCLPTVFLSHGYQMTNSWIACLGICSFPRTQWPYPVLFTST